MDNLSLPLLLLLFAVAAGAVWAAGKPLSDATDKISDRLHLGQALGGLIVLAIVTNLPEIAITISASLKGKIDVAVGNLLGGIAIQTVVLAILDAWGSKEKPLTSRAKSLVPVLEAVLVVVVLTLTVMGHQLPASASLLRLPVSGVVILGAWVLGLHLVSKARKGLPWHTDSDDKKQGGEGGDKEKDGSKKEGDKKNFGKTVVVFAVGALVTLVAGVVLEVSGDAIAKHIGLSGALFAATVLAASTSLPELSTGLAAIKNKDYELAVGDIFGGNAFLPVLFLLAGVVSGKAVLPSAHKTDMYLTGVGILVSLVYVYGLIFRPRKQIFRMGLDSFAVVVVYLIGMIGLAFVKG